MTTLPASVDRDMVDHRIIFALKAIREVLSCTIHEAIDVFAVRYEELRRDRPDDFSVGPRSTSGTSTPDRWRTGVEDQVSSLKNRRGASHRGFKPYAHRPAQRPLTWWIGRGRRHAAIPRLPGVPRDFPLDRAPEGHTPHHFTRRDWYSEEFVAPPSWAAAFARDGFVVLDCEQLTMPLSDVDTSVLTQGEWREIRFYDITTLGGVIFNAWD